MRFLLWLLISLLGAAAVGVAAFQRGEPVNALWLVVAGVCTFAVAYRFYSAWLVAKVLTIDDKRAGGGDFRTVIRPPNEKPSHSNANTLKCL